MDIKQLQALLAVADNRSFSGAARALATVQSNVSAHIARLEAELGVVLVDRQRGGLTDEGEIVAERARRILHEIDDIGADISSLGADVKGAARIGCIGTTARWLLPRLLTQLARDYPHVHPTIYEGSTSTLVKRLLDGELDAAIVHFPVESNELVAHPLFSEDLILLSHTSHELAKRKTISLEELSSYRITLPPRGSAMRKIIDRAAANRGVQLEPLAEIDGVRLMTSLALENFSPTIVPATAIPGWLTGDFTRIAVPELPKRVVGWVQRIRPRPSRPTLVVGEVTKEIVQKRANRQPGVHLEVGALRRTV